VSRGEYAPAAASPPTPVVTRRPATILVAEDEPMVRSLIARALSEVGHRVLAAENGEQALDLAERHDGTIDLLVSDVLMPGVDGPELAQRLRAQRSGLRVLFISGYRGDSEWQGKPGQANHFLSKPFTDHLLLEKVTLVLAEP
jgi:CheY-like chemotaxis protein